MKQTQKNYITETTEEFVLWEARISSTVAVQTQDGEWAWFKPSRIAQDVQVRRWKEPEPHSIHKSFDPSNEDDYKQYERLYYKGNKIATSWSGFQSLLKSEQEIDSKVKRTLLSGEKSHRKNLSVPFEIYAAWEVV